MFVYLNYVFNHSVSFLKEKIALPLNSQQKKICVIASIAFAFLATYCWMSCCSKKKIHKIESDDDDSSDNEEETLSFHCPPYIEGQSTVIQDLPGEIILEILSGLESSDFFHFASVIQNCNSFALKKISGQFNLPDQVVCVGKFNKKGFFKGRISCEGKVREGEFRNGKLNGEGKITYPNEISLEGEFIDDKLDTRVKAKIHLKSKRTFEGLFDNILAKGEYIFAGNGQIKYQTNEEKIGNLAGTGTITCQELIGEVVYEGEFKDSLCDGDGTLFLNDMIIEGEFERGHLKRAKKITLPDGTTYEANNDQDILKAIPSFHRLMISTFFLLHYRYWLE